MSVEQRMQRLAIQPSELLPLALYTYMYMYMHEPTVALNSACMVGLQVYLPLWKSHCKDHQGGWRLHTTGCQVLE